MKIFYSALFLFMLSFSVVNAASITCGTNTCDDTTQTCTDGECVTKVGSGTCPKGTVCLDNPLGETNINILIGKIIKNGLGIAGSVALIFFIYGGFTWMTSGGGDGVKKGKDILVWATYGLIMVFSSYAVLKFIFKEVLGNM